MLIRSKKKSGFNACGLEITELSTHLQGQLVAVNPVYDSLFDAFAPDQFKNNPSERQKWAVQQVKYAAKASQNLGLNASVTFSGALLWPMMYPWPQRPAGLVETGFAELAKRWTPILNYYEECGIDLCYEIHPGEDLHDGITYEMFLDHVKQHPRACLLYDPSHFVLQCLDYLGILIIITSASKCSTLRTRNLIQQGNRVFMAVTKIGLTVRAVSAHWEMDRLILKVFSVN